MPKMIPCPFHRDDTPSMAVYEDHAYCFGCGIRVPLEKIGVFIQDDHRRKKRPFPTDMLYTWQRAREDVAKAYEYLDKRDLLPALSFMEFGYWKDRLVIPMKRRDGSLFGLIGRATKNQNPKYIFIHKPTESLPFVPSWNLLLGKIEIFVFFGVITAIAGAIAGLPSVASPNGKNMKAETLDFWGDFITIVPDRGEEKEAEILRQQLPRNWRVSIIRPKWPDHVKDFDELRLAVGIEKAKQFLIEGERL